MVGLWRSTSRLQTNCTFQFRNFVFQTFVLSLDSDCCISVLVSAVGGDDDSNEAKDFHADVSL